MRATATSAGIPAVAYKVAWQLLQATLANLLLLPQQLTCPNINCQFLAMPMHINHLCYSTTCHPSFAAGEVGDEECFPALAACLSDPELCEAAHAALWRTFMRHPNPDVQVSNLWLSDAAAWCYFGAELFVLVVTASRHWCQFVVQLHGTAAVEPYNLELCAPPPTPQT